MNEQDVCLQLSNWFKQHGYLVLQDRKNGCDNETFHVKGESRKKPDLLINKYGYINAIEVKIGNDSLPIRTNSDLITYFCNYNEDKTLYYSDDEELLQIQNFLIATYYSPEGYLRDGDQLRKCGENHYHAYLYRRNPKNEYSETFTIIRGSIWDVAKYNGYYQKYKNKETGIGAVLSTKLDEDNIGKPGFLVMKNHIRNDGSNRTWWTQWITL